MALDRTAVHMENRVMSPEARCDEIVRMIDGVLGDGEVPTVHPQTSAEPASVAGREQQPVGSGPSGLRFSLQRDVLGPFWSPGTKPERYVAPCPVAVVPMRGSDTDADEVR